MSVFGWLFLSINDTRLCYLLCPSSSINLLSILSLLHCFTTFSFYCIQSWSIKTPKKTKNTSRTCFFQLLPDQPLQLHFSKKWWKVRSSVHHVKFELRFKASRIQPFLSESYWHRFQLSSLFLWLPISWCLMISLSPIWSLKIILH